MLAILKADGTVDNMCRTNMFCIAGSGDARVYTLASKLTMTLTLKPSPNTAPDTGPDPCR